MHVGFTPLRANTYPNSLLGVYSVLRQMLLDAQRYREHQQVYERAPLGTRRPEQNRSLAALLPVLDGTMPVVMYADQEREITRALDLAQEFKLRAIIAGGLESDKVRPATGQQGPRSALFKLSPPQHGGLAGSRSRTSESFA